MTVPASLFVDTPEVEDASLTHLSNNDEEWPEEIVQRLKERLPSAAGLSTIVKFMKKDGEVGAAVGSVIVSSSDRSVVVPLIVKDHSLCPLDVMLAKGRVLPLTPDYFDAAMSKGEVFDKLDEYPMFSGVNRFEENNIWNSVQPPSGRYAYASGGYPMLEHIASTIDGTEFKEFLKKQANEKVAARLLTGPHKEIAIKLASLKPLPEQHFIKAAKENVRRPIMVMKKVAANQYTVFTNSDKTFNPSLVSLDRSDAVKYLSTMTSSPDALLDGLEMEGEKLLVAPKDHGGHVLAVSHHSSPVECQIGRYTVKTSGGIAVDGFVFQKVIDFDQNLVCGKMFIGKGVASLQDNIWGVPLESKIELDFDLPKTGDTGVFVYSSDMYPELQMCTIPVVVNMVVADEHRVKLKVQDMMGKPLNLLIQPNSEFCPQRIIKMSANEYLLPGDKLKWVPIGKMVTVTNSKADYLVKEAAKTITTDPITVIPTGHGQYSIKGLDKYAEAMGWDKTNLGRAEAMFLLASVGCNGSTIHDALAKTASSRIQSYTERPRLAAEKIAMARPLAHILVKKAAAIKSNLTKEASYLENTQTVDTLLSLNFVTPDNLSKFVAKIPAFKGAISNLAGCLLAARVGVKEIPEQAASTAMNRLIDVVKGLEAIKSSQALGATQ